jgi:hypothetical protein
LLDLDPVTMDQASKSLLRGGTEFVTFTNSALIQGTTNGQVYYIGVKSEDQMASEFGFFGFATDKPFGALNANAALKEAPFVWNFASNITDFTLFIPAKNFLNTYAFFSMIMFGSVYYIMPTLFPGEKLCPKMIRIHFFLAVAGISLTFFPLAIGGLVQGVGLLNPAANFADILKGALMFLRITTIGEVLLLAGNAAFVVNVTGVVYRFYRVRAIRAYAEATTTVSPAEAQL